MRPLKDLSTKAPDSLDKKESKARIEVIKSELLELQNLLIANSNKSILVILQGMDASGKDGIIRDVFTGLNPTNCSISSFKKPSELEMKHDFLWRIHQVAPAKGEIKVFNRSHYEDVIIQKVHNWVDNDMIMKRYKQINNFETLLEENGTKIIKCYLHVSPEKQLERLTERKENLEEHYKHNDNDWVERTFWDSYMEAYEMAFQKCNTIPWNIVPADNGWYKSLIIAELLLKSLKDMNMQYPNL